MELKSNRIESHRISTTHTTKQTRNNYLLYSTKNIYLVSELCSGGELYDRVVDKTKSKEGHFSEFTAARIVKNILSAISYCHDVKNIVHRDLVSGVRKVDSQRASLSFLV